MYNNSKNILHNDKPLTRNTGDIVYDDNNSITTLQPSDTVLDDVYLSEKLAHFNRERIPERVVHAKGAGAFGFFEVTNDLSRYTCANFLSNIGKVTPVLTRFSTVGGERGSADTARDPRGFAVKFYTQEGNYDIVGNNTPIFFIRDAIKFPDFIHSQKRNPVTNLPDHNAFWDFLSLTPESVFMQTRLLSDFGTPNGFRHMDGFGTNTFMWYPNDKEYFWVKYHWKTAQGVKNLTALEAEQIAGSNPNYATEDLYSSIANGKFPVWNLFVQILTPKQAIEYPFNIFDVTKIITEKDYPLIPVGRMTLNKIPSNFHNEIEQAAFCPGNFVYGIGPSPDKMLNARTVFYSDAQRYRLGANFNQLPVNAPISPMNTYQRDGLMNTNTASAPNYFPNSFNGAQPQPKLKPPSITVEGSISRHMEPITDKDFIQPSDFYDELGDEGQKHLIENICNSLKLALLNIQYRQTALLYKTNKNYGMRVAQGLNLNPNMVMYLASLSQDERVLNTRREK